MFDDLSPWIALAFVATLAGGALLSKIFEKPRHHDDRVHPAE